MNSDRYGGPVGLLPRDALNVDDKLFPVDGDDFADLLALVVAPDDLHLVVLADGQRADAVLRALVLGQRGAHVLSAHVRGSVEVALAVLAARAGDKGIQLHDSCGERGLVYGTKTDHPPRRPRVDLMAQSDYQQMPQQHIFPTRLRQNREQK